MGSPSPAGRRVRRVTVDGAEPRRDAPGPRRAPAVTVPGHDANEPLSAVVGVTESGSVGANVTSDVAPTDATPPTLGASRVAPEPMELVGDRVAGRPRGLLPQALPFGPMPTSTEAIPVPRSHRCRVACGRSGRSFSVRADRRRARHRGPSSRSAQPPQPLNGSPPARRSDEPLARTALALRDQGSWSG
jgi:hypothetical protein